ncbi:triphosphoribosyl-dephospho-CoA synthase [Jiella mangrovi]|uniref:Triphosphoribosyl-dephospho-CoA synthase n=1 Tax=Jiella mangrovi TaxID=2821407 RepID=A0ABS4BEE7_9HYPH|nr:triphosphoribosyl-dephospho-CoA synthase [Jiella mangrovi]MBP0615118.1 triphosphoribosyl-dephospho-CoA synthase [Jiella mangrovi]
MSLSSATVEAAFLAACHAEIETLKPGNVHRFAAGHGMTTETFRAAAKAAAPAIARTGAPVGARILAATEASFAAVGVNANLGILLLCAPLAAAAETTAAESAKASSSRDLVAALRSGLDRVLADLGADDAKAAFAAIALANPGGLVRRPENDVRDAPTISLVEAMALVSDSDLVARQYAKSFEDIFETRLAAADVTVPTPIDVLGDARTVRVFLSFAGKFPDSHIARKFGSETAEATRVRFQEFSNTLNGLSDPQEILTVALGFDNSLKQEGLNPGTSADLTVATLFARNLAEALRG